MCGREARQCCAKLIKLGMKVLDLGFGKSRRKLGEGSIGLLLPIESGQANTPAVHKRVTVAVPASESDVRKPPSQARPVRVVRG